MSRHGCWIRSVTREAIYLRDGYTCAYRGPRCTGNDVAKLTLDHTDGADIHAPTSLVTACLTCNSSRQDTPVRTWCETSDLNGSTVWRRIRALQSKPIGPYRDAVKTMRRMGVEPRTAILGVADPFDQHTASDL